MSVRQRPTAADHRETPMSRNSTDHTSRLGWMAKALTAAAVTATTVLGLTGSAFAYTGSAAVGGPAPSSGMYTDGQSTPPPTPNLQSLNSNINLYFTYSGVEGELSFSLGKNQTHYIPEFARSWSEVGVSDDLRVPSIAFYDEDFHFSGAWIEGYPASSDQRILPAATGSHL